MIFKQNKSNIQVGVITKQNLKKNDFIAKFQLFLINNFGSEVDTDVIVE